MGFARRRGANADALADGELSVRLSGVWEHRRRISGGGVADLDQTYRAVAADRGRFADEHRSLWRAALTHAFGRNPRDTIALAVVALAVGAILINALHLQPGPH